MRKFTHIHCWTANLWFSRPRLYVDDEAGMRSSVQVVRITSGCRHSSSSAMLKVPSSYSVLPKKNKLDVCCFISDQSITFISQCFFIHDGSFVVIFDHYVDLQIYRSEYFTLEGFFYSAQLVV